MADQDHGGLTLGERIRRIEDIADKTLAYVSELNARDSADHVRLSNNERRIDGLEQSVTWLWRSVLGAVIVVIINIVANRG